MLSCTTNPRFVGISQRADGSLHSAADSAATSGLPGFFLSALRFMIAVIFKGLHRTLTASCGDLPNRAPAFASPDVVHSGLVMSAPSASTSRRHAFTMHVGASGG